MHRLALQAPAGRGIGRIALAAVAGLLLGAAGPKWTPQDMPQRVLAAHNAERAKLGEKPLVWSDALAAHAAAWADHLATLSELEHDKSLDVEGENLWRGSKDAYTPEDMVELWIDERKAFKLDKIPNTSTTGDFEDVGHYTQLVWRSTTQVGCAIRTAGEDEVLVCRYMEGGNVIGEAPY